MVRTSIIAHTSCHVFKMVMKLHYENVNSPGLYLVGTTVWNLSFLSMMLATVCNIFMFIRLLNNNNIANSGSIVSLSSPLSVLPLANLQKCNNTPVLPLNPLLGRWDASHLYKLYDSVLIGDKYTDVASQFSVCLATQTSLERMHSLVQVAQNWGGSISVALFAAGDLEFNLLQGYVAYLRRCNQPIKERVAFHVLLPRDHMPGYLNVAEPTDEMDCLQPKEVMINLTQRMGSPETQAWRYELLYPQNHLRNLARKNCQSSYVFLTDVDIIPNLGAAEALNVFLKDNKCQKCAYVIPTYELDESAQFPANKPELIHLSKQKLARPYHDKLYSPAQAPTNFSRWEEDLRNGSISISFTNEYRLYYEPFYVAKDTVPVHDEQFVGFGSTRNSQVYEMALAGYKFTVLSPIFTCHWGFASLKNNRTHSQIQQTSNNARKFGALQKELLARYREL